jgi:hypothetical protein
MCLFYLVAVARVNIASCKGYTCGENKISSAPVSAKTRLRLTVEGKVVSNVVSNMLSRLGTYGERVGVRLAVPLLGLQEEVRILMYARCCYMLAACKLCTCA